MKLYWFHSDGFELIGHLAITTTVMAKWSTGETAVLAARVRAPHECRFSVQYKVMHCRLLWGHSMSSAPISGNIPTSPSPILMKFYQLLQLLFKLGAAKFQLQIINGWCTIITNVEESFAAAGFFYDK